MWLSRKDYDKLMSDLAYGNETVKRLEMEKEAWENGARETLGKAAKLSAQMGLLARWFTANLLASGRRHRVLTVKQVEAAIPYNLQAQQEDDGSIKLGVVDREAKDVEKIDPPGNGQGLSRVDEPDAPDIHSPIVEDLLKGHDPTDRTAPPPA